MELDRRRLGWFFVFVGLVLMVIFFTTDQARNPSYGFFFFGIAFLFLGGSTVWRNRKPDDESSRFRTVRKIQQKRAQRKTRKN